MTKRARLLVSLIVLLSLALMVTGCTSTKPQTTPGNTPAPTATNYPTKPITVINSSTAGSASDVMAREVARYAEPVLKQPLVVVNKTGGSGGPMFAGLLTEPADGYTIGVANAGQLATLQAELKGQFKFEDFEFLANVQMEPYAIAVKSDSPFKTLKDMIDYAKANPGKLKLGGQGTGTLQQILVKQLEAMAQITATYIPYGGGSEAVTAALGGTVQAISTAPATVNAYVEAGQMRILAVAAAERTPMLKDFATFKEQGFDIQLTQWRGFFAKKGMPADVKAKLVDAIKKATQDKGFKDYMAKNNMEDAFIAADEFQALAKKDYEAIGKALASLNKQ